MVIISTEEELITGLIIQDKEIFEELYIRYKDKLFEVILSIVKEETIAEELLQNTFIKIWDKTKTHYSSDKGKLFTWFLNIAMNISIDYLRSKRYKNSLVTQSIFKSDLNTESNLISFSSIKKIETTDIYKSLSLLNKNQSEVLYLKYFEDMTGEEIAQYLS